MQIEVNVILNLPERLFLLIQCVIILSVDCSLKMCVGVGWAQLLLGNLIIVDDCGA